MQALIQLTLAVLSALSMTFWPPGLPGARHPQGGTSLMVHPWGYTYDGVVAVKSESDTNYDGKIDRVCHFRRHAIERLEWDLDHDGEFDLRATYAEPADGAANVRYRLNRLNKDYRLVPDITAATYPTHHVALYADPPPRYEARVDGEWRDSFTLDLPLSEWHASQDEAAPGVMTFVCEDGLAVSLTTAAEPDADRPYQQTQYQNGKPVSSVVGPAPGQPTHTMRYTYGDDPRMITRTDRDDDGEPDFELSAPLWAYATGINLHQFNVIVRSKIDGEWTGTFVDEQQRNYGNLQLRYIDGRLTDMLSHDGARVLEHRDYDESGTLLWAYTDHDADGRFDMRQSADDRVFKRVNDQWVGDFVLEREGPEGAVWRYTYRDGRLIHSDVNSPKETLHTVVEYPEPNVEIIRSSGVGLLMWGKVWNEYAPGSQGVSQLLLRTAIDTNADGTPDLFVDFQALTISETRPKDWPE